MKDEILKKARSVAGFLTEHRGLDTQIIDVSGQCSWTDCFVITTVNSAGHLRGLSHELRPFLSSLGLKVRNPRKSPSGEGWELLDCNEIVIHLMNQEMRIFYNLEKLWTLPDAETQAETQGETQV